MISRIAIEEDAYAVVRRGALDRKMLRSPQANSSAPMVDPIPAPMRTWATAWASSSVRVKNAIADDDGVRPARVESRFQREVELRGRALLPEA